MTNPAPVTLALNAMATRFELVLHGHDPVRLHAAGEEALREIERLDAQLSFYRRESELTWINANAARELTKVEPRLFRLLQRCAELTASTDGAFDVTIAPLVRAWSFTGGTGRTPDPAELEAAREVVGMWHVLLDEEGFAVRFDREGVKLDLGAIGKGYAVEQAVGILRDNGIESALLHGGTSMICAIGAPPGQENWRVTIRHPLEEDRQLDAVNLRDNSLSVSAVHGKSFTDGLRKFGHVIDPRTGSPVEGTLAAAAVGPSPTVCDALSTALLVLGEPGLVTLAERFPDYSALLAIETSDGVSVRSTKHHEWEAKDIAR